MLGDGYKLKHVQLAIDGPAGAGKSTIAKRLAQYLNISYIDTGAMYRALTYKALQEKININNSDEIINLSENTDILFLNGNIYIDGRLANEEIRSKEVTAKVSFVAKIPEVRKILLKKQQKMASDSSVVMDGRDIGTHVLPQADLKIFLTASVEERANRRYLELIEKGFVVYPEDVQREIMQRDKIDTERECAPLLKAEDAVIIDTTGLTIDEIVSRIIKLLYNKI